jgi:hypothetical protein
VYPAESVWSPKTCKRHNEYVIPKNLTSLRQRRRVWNKYDDVSDNILCFLCAWPSEKSLSFNLHTANYGSLNNVIYLFRYNTGTF